MQPADGELVFYGDGSVKSAAGGVLLSEFGAAEAEELSVKPGVGCGLIYAKMKAEEGQTRREVILCRFSMSGLKNAGEFCKIVNYYITTGDVSIPEEIERQTCEKCGRPLAEGLNECLFCFDRLSVWKKFFHYFRPYVKRFFSAQLCLMVARLFLLAIPILNRFLIDGYLRPKRGTLSDILVLAGAMFAARIICELVYIITSRVYFKIAISYSNDLRVKTFTKLQSLSLGSLSRRTQGDLIKRVMDDTGEVRNFLTGGGRWMIEHSVTFVVVLAIFLLTDVKLTLLVFAPVPFVALAMYRFRKFIRGRYERQWRKNSKCSSILIDIIKGIRTVKSFGSEEKEIGKFSAAAKDLAQVSSDNEKFWSLLFPSLMFFMGTGELLVLYFGGKAVLGDALSLGILVQFTMYISYIYEPLRWLVSLPRVLAETMTSMVKVFEILDEKPEITESREPNNVPVSGGVRFDGVSFGYKSYEPVLKNIDLDIKPGEMIGLVGRSGVGKSTLINLLLRLYDPNSGKVSINGTDIRDMSPDHLHESIGVVFQDTFLFAGTIFDNIAYGKPGATLEEVIRAARTANAHGFIMQTPDGYNTVIGENGHTISGGERQRLSIARAVIKNPDILILDEATSALDAETEASIQESLDRVIKGRTTVAIAHRLSTLRNADRLIVLDKGAVAEVGTHIELLKMKGIYYKLVMAQRKSHKMADA